MESLGINLPGVVTLLISLFFIVLLIALLIGATVLVWKQLLRTRQD